MSKRIGIRFYNALNLGDDLFLHILANRYSGYEVLISGRHKPKIQEDVHVLSSHRYIAYRLLGKLFGLDYINRWVAKSSEVYIYVGGSVFIEGDNLAGWDRERQFYSKLSVPYFILGSNFGPYKTEEFMRISRGILAGARDVCFRDKASYELFQDVSSVRSATDIAFTLDATKFSPKSQKKQVVFSVIDAYGKFDAIIADRYEQEIINLSSKLIEEGYDVTLMSFCKYEGDENAIASIKGKMDSSLQKRVETYMYRGDLDKALGVLMDSEMIVASRFHAAILGLLFGKKVLPMAYSDKTTNILKDMSFRGPVVDIRKISEFDGASFDFSKLEMNDVSDQVQLAEKQFQELDKVLTKRK